MKNQLAVFFVFALAALFFSSISLITMTILSPENQAVKLGYQQPGYSQQNFELNSNPSDDNANINKLVDVLIRADDLDRAYESVKSTGTAKKHKAGKVISAAISENDINSLANKNSVYEILPNRAVQAFSIDEVSETNVQSFWENNFTGKGIKVAVLDTGINSGRIIASGDFIGEGTNDQNGHGTKIAEIILAMAPNAEIINAKVLDKNGLGSEASVIAGINFAIEKKADVISLSLGGLFNDIDSPLVAAVEDAISSGVTVVVAAGNCKVQGMCGNFTDIATPGNAPNAITVGSVNSENAVDYSAGHDFGNYIKPDVVAPEKSNSLTGTSASTPFVSGAAALIIEKYHSNPLQVKLLIENNAKDLGIKGKDAVFGAGKLNLDFMTNETTWKKIDFIPQITRNPSKAKTIKASEAKIMVLDDFENMYWRREWPDQIDYLDLSAEHAFGNYSMIISTASRHGSWCGKAIRYFSPTIMVSNYSTISFYAKKGNPTYGIYGSAIAISIIDSDGNWHWTGARPQVDTNQWQKYDVDITGFTNISGIVFNIDSDGWGSTSPADLLVDQLEIRENTPPVLDYIGDKNVFATQTLSFSVSASDIDNNVLTYSAQNLPSNAVFNSQQFSWTPAMNQIGRYQIIFSVSDGKAVTSEAITIDVNPINYAVFPDYISLEDFEDISDWQKECGSLYGECDVLKSYSQSADSESGAYSMTLSSQAYAGCWAGKIGKIFTIPISLTNYSTLSFYAKKGNPAYGDYDPSIAITLLDSQGNTYVYGSYTSGGGIIISNSSWQRYVFKLPETISDVSHIQIDLYSAGWGTTSPADLLIDRFELRQNNAPVLQPIGSKQVNEGSSIQFTISAADPDNDDMAYSASDLPSGASFDSSTGAFTWTPSYTDSGDYSVTFSVTDGSLSNSETINIEVRNTNRAPAITSTAVTTAIAGAAYSYDVNANDEDGDVLTYSLTTNPEGMTIDSATGVISWMPISAETYNVVVSVTDSINEPITQSFSITVTTANLPPVLASVGNKVVNENSALTFTITATDQNGDALTYSAFNLPSGASFDTSTGAFTWTPTMNQIGVYTITFSVSDNILSDSEEIAINVTRGPLNYRITSNNTILEDFEDISDWQKECGSLYGECDVLRSFSKSSDAKIENYSMILSSSAYSGCWAGKIGKVFNIPANLTGYSTFSFYAKKGNSTYGDYNPSIAITLLDSGGNPYVYGDYYSCGGITISNTQWQKYNFDLPTTISNISHIQIDLYSAGWGTTSPADLLIDNLELRQNNAPVLQPIGNKQVNESSALQFTISAADPDNDVLAYSASDLPSGASFDSLTKTFSWTPNHSQSGIYRPTFYVADWKLESSETINITVNDVNQAPIFQPIGNKQINTTLTLSFVIFAADVDGDVMNYSVQNLPSGAAFSGQQFRWTPTLSQVGSYQVTFAVSDLKAVTTETITITVNPLNYATVSDYVVLEDFEDISDWEKECSSLYGECDVLRSFSKSSDAKIENYSMTLSSSAYSGCWAGKIGKVLNVPLSLSGYSTFSFYAKKGNSSYGSYNPSMAITLVDSYGKSFVYGSYTGCGGITISDSSWQKYTFDLPTTISNIGHIQIDLYSAGPGATSPADVLIDEIEINPYRPCVPEYSCAAWYPSVCPMVINGIYFREQARTCTDTKCGTGDHPEKRIC